MIELALLLLPVAAASGWYAAKRDQARNTESDDCAASREYFVGLNYVLNEQPDKAIDLFVRMVEVDHQTIETHLALGNLFRRRGEVDRAIRIHQNLVSRDTLTAEQRGLSLLELGQDYMRAGLFDRAENLFDELVESGLHRQSALQYLKTIYEQEREWDKCLETTRQLEDLGCDALSTQRAHYLCEKAELARSSGDISQAVELLNQASICNETCVRATILLGRISMDQKKWSDAADKLWRVANLDHTYLPTILSDLHLCHQRIGNESELRERLHRVYDRHHGRAELLLLTDLIQASEGEEIALSFLSTQLQRYPSLAGLERLITLDLKSVRSGDRHNGTLRIIRPLISQLVEQQPAFQCNRCGFDARELHWQCPGCKTWHSLKPRNDH